MSTVIASSPFVTRPVYMFSSSPRYAHAAAAVASTTMFGRRRGHGVVVGAFKEQRQPDIAVGHQRGWLLRRRAMLIRFWVIGSPIMFDDDGTDGHGDNDSESGTVGGGSREGEETNAYI